LELTQSNIISETKRGLETLTGGKSSYGNPDRIIGTVVPCVEGGTSPNREEASCPRGWESIGRCAMGRGVGERGFRRRWVLVEELDAGSKCRVGMGTVLPLDGVGNSEEGRRVCHLVVKWGGL